MDASPRRVGLSEADVASTSALVASSMGSFTRNAAAVHGTRKSGTRVNEGQRRVNAGANESCLDH